MIYLWLIALEFFIADIMWWVIWTVYDLFAFVRDIIMYFVLYIPNLILYYWGLLMSAIFKPLDDICVWWWSIFDEIADVLMAFVIPPEWDPAWGPEVILSLPIKALLNIKIDDAVDL